ncbi:hypothetical protein [Pseudomonas sp. H1h]|uniref:hypothetical protein n=1 Tax=Pseudomonas sp. H1h TaxID=1397280 RepID=UPI0004683433|nr:hypothetical protein [Pseudomonas sp. H1h]
MTANTDSSAVSDLQRIEGTLQLKTERQVEITSSQLETYASRDKTNTTFSFSLNTINNTQRQTFSITLSNKITSGTYPLDRLGNFIGAHYLEQLKIDDTTYQSLSSEGINGSLTIVVDDSGTGQRIYKINTFSISVKAVQGNAETQVLAGNLIVAQGDVTLDTLLPNINALAARLQNITGEFNARFLNINGQNSRAPYTSRSIQNHAFEDDDYLSFRAIAGDTALQPRFASDRREFLLKLKKDIASGTHTFKQGVPGSILDVQYAEIRYSDITKNHQLISTTALEATLDLKISSDGLCYSSNDFNLKVQTSSGSILIIESNFKIYLTNE